MKAKDTILKETEIKKIWGAWIILPSPPETFSECLCQHQAEASFKAGMIAVVEWAQGVEYIDNCVFRAQLEDKKKEWGIEAVKPLYKCSKPLHMCQFARCDKKGKCEFKYEAKEAIPANAV